MLNVIVSNKKWHQNFVAEIENITNTKLIYINSVDLLTVDYLQELSPRYVFIPHWSYIIPKSIYENFECVIFHMTDLPFGRGGTPLQNLIVRGIYETKISALRCNETVDGGDVYLKYPLSLYGSAEEIYLRAAELTKDMIVEIITGKIVPVQQSGDIVNFPRRKKEDSNIKDIKTLEKVFDYIRMLDAEGYPRAFLNTDNLHLEFDRAILKNGYIKADVKISLRNNGNEE